MLPWALLLTLIFQDAGAGDWDHPACTEGVVSVTRGAPAEMTCNISNPFHNVSVCLLAPGRRACRPVSTQAAPGCSSRAGWQLCVQGRLAKMVTEEAQDSQAGQYRWTLVGCQTEQEFTTLNVSEPPERPSTPPWGTQDPRPVQDLHSAQDPPPWRLHVALILVPMLLCVLALGGLHFWHRNLGRPMHVPFPTPWRAAWGWTSMRPRTCGTRVSAESSP